jgi:hypothetical protein
LKIGKKQKKRSIPVGIEPGPFADKGCMVPLRH